MQIETTLRFNLLRSNVQATDHVSEDIEKREHFFITGVNANLQSLGKSIWHFLRKLGKYLLQEHEMPLLVIYPKEAPLYHKDN